MSTTRPVYSIADKAPEFPCELLQVISGLGRTSERWIICARHPDEFRGPLAGVSYTRWRPLLTPSSQQPDLDTSTLVGEHIGHAGNAPAHFQQPEQEGAHQHNPAHPIGTCANCGGEMIYNVPRMGPDGGFIHKDTGKVECPAPPPTAGMSGGEPTPEKAALGIALAALKKTLVGASTGDGYFHVHREAVRQIEALGICPAKTDDYQGL